MLVRVLCVVCAVAAVFLTMGMRRQISVGACTASATAPGPAAQTDYWHAITYGLEPDKSRTLAEQGRTAQARVATARR